MSPISHVGIYHSFLHFTFLRLVVGVAGSGLALADSQKAETFVRLLTIEIFGSALGLFGIIVGLI